MDAAAFTDTSLARYKAVVWLSTTGDVLDANQQAAFERYIRAGGGYVGLVIGVGVVALGSLIRWLKKRKREGKPALLDIALFDSKYFRYGVSGQTLQQIALALRRAGLDYHEFANVQVHASYEDLKKALAGRRMFALSTRGTRGYARVEFRVGDAFVFGAETKGLPEELLEEFPGSMRLRLPMLPGNRSLNLSNAVAVVVFEAWRQNGFACAPSSEASRKLPVRAK